MTVPEQQKKLHSMMKKKWSVEDQIFKFETFQIKHSLLTIATDSDWITRPADQIEKFIKDCKPVEGSTEIAVIENSEDPTGAMAIVDSEFNFSKLHNIAMDNIKKLQGDNGKQYVQQAQAINGSMKTIIEMAKTKILAVGIISKMK